MKKFHLLALLAALALLQTALAQPSLKALERKNKREKNPGWRLHLTAPTRGIVKFAPGSRPEKISGKAWLQSALQLRAGKDELKVAPHADKHPEGLEVESLSQLFAGIPVEHGTVKVLQQNGAIAAMQLEFYAIPDTFNTKPALSEKEALAFALNRIGAERYAWQENKSEAAPRGTLVIVEDFYKNTGTLHLAYRFDISAAVPFSRNLVYVSAHTGKILLVDPVTKHLNGHGSPKADISENSAAAVSAAPPNVAGNASTRYSGTRPLITDNGSTTPGLPYRLRQSRNGHSIITLNYGRRVASSANNSLAVDFLDNDNNWTTAELSFNYDNAALDVHLAMQYLSDYWLNVHGRWSWNNQGAIMRSYVHVRDARAPASGYDNAFWGGSAMYYGDGTYYSTDGSGTVANTRGFKPLTSLDVSAHELGHAVCATTAALVYERESGALNEGFSDIWAACADWYTNLGKQPWIIGEDITASGAGLRNMQNPKANGSPDTYGGQNWWATTLEGCNAPDVNMNDNCGVHINSGVLNKWFYLLVQGGSGTNDKGSQYGVTGLGIAVAEKIAYVTELNLSPNATFADAREVSIAVAEALYGTCSDAAAQVTNAWYAVGVGTTANCSPVPAVEFAHAATSVAEGVGRAGNCGSVVHVPVVVKLTATPNTPAQVNFQFAGTATQGSDYHVAQTELTLTSQGTAVLDLYIDDDATPEPAETIVIGFTVNANGGNAIAGANNQVYTITIANDDEAPTAIRQAPVSDVTLLSENFDGQPSGTVFPAGWSVSGNLTGAGETNQWTIGANTGGLVGGKAAYISNTAATVQDYAYDPDVPTEQVLFLPELNTTGLKNIRLSFRYQVEGEFYPLGTQGASVWDYALVFYSTDGSNYYPLTNPENGEPLMLYGTGGTVQSFDRVLPEILNNKPLVGLALYWTNDAIAAGGPPLLVDEILVKGTTTEVSIETSTGQVQAATVLAGTGATFLATNNGKNLVAQISNSSQDVHCIEASLRQGGTGTEAILLSGKSYLRSSKVISLKPAVPNSTATYTATFYFTTTELSGWTPAEIAALKILKVKEGVNLDGPITAADAELVTPVVNDQSANGYYAFTGNFTGFSQFMLVEGASVLPVRLLHFTAKVVGAHIYLSWQTNAEQNNRGFVVERSTNGSHFEPLGWVAASGAASGSYHFADNTALPGVLYTYRLKQQDVDGKFTYSPYQNARLPEKGSGVFVWPNPAQGYTQLLLTGGVPAGPVWLTDSRGAVVRSWQGLQAGIRHNLNLQGLAPGFYLLWAGGGATKLVVR